MYKPKILIVDDDPDSIELIKHVLSKHNYEIETATNGTQAVSMFIAQMPDIILLDIMMPGIDGFVTLRKIKGLATEQGLEPSVIMLTAKGGSQDVLSAIKFGAKDYLVKPVTESRLIDTITKYL